MLSMFSERRLNPQQKFEKLFDAICNLVEEIEPMQEEYGTFKVGRLREQQTQSNPFTTLDLCLTEIKGALQKQRYEDVKRHCQTISTLPPNNFDNKLAKKLNELITVSSSLSCTNLSNDSRTLSH